MDLFDKVVKYTIADESKAAGIYPYFHQLQTSKMLL